MTAYRKTYINGAEFIHLSSGEVHMKPTHQGWVPPTLVKDFLRLRAKRQLFTKHAVLDTKTPSFNRRVGLTPVKMDFAFVYYQTKEV